MADRDRWYQFLLFSLFHKVSSRKWNSSFSPFFYLCRQRCAWLKLMRIYVVKWGFFMRIFICTNKTWGKKRATKINGACCLFVLKMSSFRGKKYSVQMSSAKDRKMIKAIIRKPWPFVIGRDYKQMFYHIFPLRSIRRGGGVLEVVNPWILVSSDLMIATTKYQRRFNWGWPPSEPGWPETMTFAHGGI